MPDIIKCNGNGCPINELCYRHTALINCDKSNCATLKVENFNYNHQTEKCNDFIPNSTHIVIGL